MDYTQRIDPNKTMMANPPTGAFDPLKTQAIGAFDPLKTTAFTAAPSDQALTVSMTPSREATMANGPAREQFLIELIGAQATLSGVGFSGGLSSRTPVNLCLVIDRSGSMEGAPLEYAKLACSQLVDMLSPNDVLSIVTFEDVVQVLMQPQRVTNKQSIKDGIAMIQPGNTTNLHDGVHLGIQQVMANQDPGRVSRIMVLTDGEPTSGIKDFTVLANLSGGLRERSISATYLGFGPDYNEELLHSMAKRAGGNYYYIANPQTIPEVFRTEMEKLLTVVARNISLQVKTARWVSLRSPVMDGGLPIQLPDLERGASIQQVFDMEFSNHPLGWYRVASGKLTYEDLITGQDATVDLDFVLEFTSDSARYSQPVNPKVAGAAQVALASKVVEKTVMGLKTGMLSPMAAMQELQKTQALLAGEGRTAEAREVTMALQALQSGDHSGAEKTLMGTMLNLDQGKSK